MGIQRDREQGKVVSQEDQLKGEGECSQFIYFVTLIFISGASEAGMHDLTEFENPYHRYAN